MHELSVFDMTMGTSSDQSPQEKLVTGYSSLMGIADVDANFLITESERLKRLLSQVEGDARQLRWEDQDSLVVLDTLKECLYGHTLSEANSLSHWLVYRDLMERFGTRGGRAALMVGAISPLSARAFEVLAKEEYGVNEAHIIDLNVTPARMRHGIFRPGNGLDMPYKAETFDILHTNQLLYTLRDTSSETRLLKQKIHILAREIARVLRPGGQLLMVEPTPELMDDQKHGRALEMQKFFKFCRFMFNCLKIAGFDMPYIETASSYVTNDFLHVPRPYWDRYAKIQWPGVPAIYGRKKAQLAAPFEMP